MDVFVYSRDATGAERLRDDPELLEEHWSYMDGFAESMIARGPTLTADRQTATGSLHVLGLPDVDAVGEFVAREPNNRAGLYAEHVVWRFENLIGRTMWEFSSAVDEPRFLILPNPDLLGDRQAGASLGRELSERLILHGALSTLEGSEPVGVALAVQAPSREALIALLEADPDFAHVLPAVDIHDWEFGGRR
jgi:uncharacterized protein YciI